MSATNSSMLSLKDIEDDVDKLKTLQNKSVEYVLVVFVGLNHS